jgi:paraquat-inducible protein B
MSKRANPAVVGAFVVGAVALAVVGVAVFGSGRLFRKTHAFVLYFDSDVNGLKIGAPVKLKGVEVGSVTKILLNLSAMGIIERRAEKVWIPVIIELDEERVREKGGRGNLDDPALLKAAIDAGLRAQLAMESFVTGLLYVKLDLFPDTTPRLINDPKVHYPEIPTVPTPLEEVQMKASRFLARLDKIDFEGLGQSITNVAKGLDQLVNSPDLHNAVESVGKAIQTVDETAQSFRKLADNLDASLAPLRQRLNGTADEATITLRQARKTLEGLSTDLQSDSPVVYQLRVSLEEVAAAARALRTLADYLERNPGSLVRGRSLQEETQ